MAGLHANRQLTLFGGPLADTAELPRKPDVNPMLAVYGSGHTGATCKNCAHLLRIRRSRTYIKCDLRKITRGHGTDHKATWPACGKYETGIGETMDYPWH